MAQLNIVGELWLEIGFTGLVCVLVQEEKEGVQVLVSGSVDPAAVVHGELALFIGLVAYIHGRVEAEIISGESGILVDDGDPIAQLMAGVVGVLHAKTGLHAPLLK